MVRGTHLKYTKLTELQPVASCQFFDNGIQERLDNILGNNFRHRGSLCNSIDEFFLRDGPHDHLPRLSAATRS